MVAFVSVSNKILEVVQLDKQTVVMNPELQEKHPLQHLSARPIYETFRDSHEIYDSDKTAVRDKMHADRDRLAVLTRSFNIASIHHILKQHRLRPRLSLDYVNKFQIRWIGYRITRKTIAKIIPII